MRIRVWFVVLLSLLWVLWVPACTSPQGAESTLEPSTELVRDAGPRERGEAPQEPTLQDAAVEPGAEPAIEPGAEPQFDSQEVPDAGASERSEALVQDGGMGEGPPESMAPRPGFGAISGECGVLDDGEWNASSPFLFRNAIDFGSEAYDKAKLSTGGQKIADAGNLGGSSLYSEIFAYEVLYRCEFATLLKTEGEIGYKDASGKKTDLLLRIDGRKIGVSVTRAFHFPPENPYTESEATNLLTKKLSDIALSAANASTQDAWGRSILSILAYNKQYADTVAAAYNKLDASVRAKVILILTVTDGKDDFVY